jgi:hypothetical protein
MVIGRDRQSLGTLKEGSMFQLTESHLVIVCVIVLLIFGSRRFPRFSLRDGESPLQAELRRRMPVFSAETTRGKEAEFIRDSLPRRLPYFLLLVAALVVGAIVWWASR